MPIVKLPGTVHSEEDFSLAPAVVDALWRMEDRHFWHRARNEWILDALRAGGVAPGANLLEVGCGSGAVLRALTLAGYAVVGVDTAEHLIEKAHRRCPTASLVVGDVAALPPGLQGPFAAIGFFDVLEHLDEPERLLRSALRWAAPGAYVLVTVPALRALHTVVDDLSGHKRRFEPGELTPLLESVGLSDVVEHGIFASTMPLQRLSRALAVRKPVLDDAAKTRTMTQALRVPALPVNLALGALARAERAQGLQQARGRVGATILGVARYRG
ncbi:MAG TPA: class I SAM-dependent methyltransferase [Polyangiaceae bacterium]|nr:class I SAM-dependent methyltransferase [Polyangiaceae bacterium]